MAGMLWRVRGTLPDRPGTLAGLASAFGEAGANILALQVFPGVENVTDELVVRAQDGTDAGAIEAIVIGAGAIDVVVQPCTEAALCDQPTRFVQAARAVAARPASFPDVVAKLFDAEPEPTDRSAQASATFLVGDVQVAIHRTAPFTDAEVARGQAIAALVSDVMEREHATTAAMVSSSSRRMGSGSTPEYVVLGDSVTAYIDDAVVGTAVLSAVATTSDGATQRTADLSVDPAWQRRGIGTRLLLDIARLAHSAGADEILLATRADNQAVLPMVLAAGLRGRIKMAGEHLTVRIAVHELRPLAR